MTENKPKRTATAVSGSTPYRTLIQTGKHEIIADETVESGGAETGPTPQDLLRMSLASCTSITLRMYADRKNWNVGEVKVSVFNTTVNDETVFECRIAFEFPPDQETMDRLLVVANKCPVHKLLAKANPIFTIVDGMQ